MFYLQDSIYRLGGLQFLMPLFDLVGQYPEASRPCDPQLLSDLSVAVEEFREAMGKKTDKMAPLTPGFEEPPLLVAKRSDAAGSMDESAQETVVNASIELLQLSATLLTTTTPMSTYNLPGMSSSLNSLIQ